jgi:hypothetical protein
MASYRLFLFPTLGLLLIASSPAARALVGDTPKQIEARYGRSHAANRDEFGNENRGYAPAPGKYMVVVTFERGRSVCESFFRPEGLRDFTPEELADIMVEYVPSGIHWKVSTTEPWRWDSADGKLTAVKPSHRLQISTVDYFRRMSTYNKTKSRKKSH